MSNSIKYIIVLLVGISLGFLSSLYNPWNKKNGALPSIEESKLHHTIDSLKNEQIKSDTIIVKINNTKTKIKYEYIKDTIYLTKLSFDSIKVLFTEEYPRYPNHK